MRTVRGPGAGFPFTPFSLRSGLRKGGRGFLSSYFVPIQISQSASVTPGGLEGAYRGHSARHKCGCSPAHVLRRALGWVHPRVSFPYPSDIPPSSPADPWEDSLTSSPPACFISVMLWYPGQPAVAKEDLRLRYLLPGTHGRGCLALHP